jgi:uncharacterized protein (DUF1330 family)
MQDMKSRYFSCNHASICPVITFEEIMANLPNVNIDEIDVFKSIAGSAEDTPILMLNLNRYVEDANFPDGALYLEYMTVLDRLLTEVGGRILWRTTIHGTVVGTQNIHEALGIWYPSHQAFLDLMTAPSSSQNMELRRRTVAHADLHRCDTF